jgi:hypothetical protein
MLDLHRPPGHPRLMTPEQRDALVAAGKHVVATSYSSWRFASISPRGAPDGYFARMAAHWLDLVASGDSDICRCALCERPIIAESSLGRIIFAWPDEADFPEMSRASVIVCARCVSRPDYRSQAIELGRDLTALVLVTVAEGTA